MTMRVDEVPQDNSATFDGGRKAMYALGEDGKYRLVPSTGWEVEELVTSAAVAEFKAQADAALARARAGLTAPLEYHMYARRMDLQTLAQSAGLMRWRVRRHLKPAVFARLPDKLLRRYAEALGLSVDELRRLPPAP